MKGNQNVVFFFKSHDFKVSDSGFLLLPADNHNTKEKEN